MASEMAPEALAELSVQFNGPMLMGAVLYLWLFGISCVMASHYYTHFEDDSLWIKILAGWSMAFGTFQAICEIHVMWEKLIDHFGTLEGLYNGPITSDLSTFTTLMISVPIQSFFASIAWRALSRNWYFAGFMGVCMLVALVSGAMLSVQLIFMGETYNTLIVEPNLYLWSMVGIDVFITAVLVVKFRTLQMGASESSRNILARFIFLFLRTAAFTTSLAVIERLCHAAGQGLISQAPGVMISGAAIISLFHTLNSRKELRARTDADSRRSRHKLDGRLGGGAGTIRRPTNAFGVASRTSLDSNENRRAPPVTEIRVDTIVLQHLDDASGETKSGHMSNMRPSGPFAPTMGATMETDSDEDRTEREKSAISFA